VTVVRDDIVVSGVALAVPGLAAAGELLGDPRRGDGFDPTSALAGREMRNKDRASRLALWVAEAALRDSGLLGESGTVRGADRTSVVVSSNLGNIDGVCQFTDTIARETSAGLSPLGLPQTSNNVIAGWIAIRHGLRGPNLTVCNGPASGLDAIYWARNLILMGRADAAVVVGVEPAAETVTKLLRAPSGDRVACVVLEQGAAAAARPFVRRRAILKHCGRHANAWAAAAAAACQWAAADDGVGLWLMDASTSSLGQSDSVRELPRWLDIEAHLGPCSGALGVLQCVAGVAYLDQGGPGSVLATIEEPGRGTAATLLLSSATPARMAEPLSRAKSTQ
jgi:3-oxoacyl-[acyl-carrier-protein] synthase II